MSRLIDAEIAYDKIAEQETSYYMDMEGVQAGLDETPTVDAVEVVRCGECENWQSGWKPSAAKDGTHFCAIVGICTRADWYCADGERKDDGDNH